MKIKPSNTADTWESDLLSLLGRFPNGLHYLPILMLFSEPERILGIISKLVGQGKVHDVGDENNRWLKLGSGLK